MPESHAPGEGTLKWFVLKLSVVLLLVGALVSPVVWAVHRSREGAARASCNLGGVVLAIICYEEAHGRLPPAALRDRDGRPLLSWRVLILPFMDSDCREVYEEFHLDEPWDSPHNLALLPRMPRLYRGPAHKESLLPPHHTVLHVLVGPGTPFEEGRKLKIPRETADTILFVEAGEPVPWTKPDEIAYDPEGPLPNLKGLFRDGFRSCLTTGSYHFVRYDEPEEELRRLLVRKGVGSPGADW